MTDDRLRCAEREVRPRRTPSVAQAVVVCVSQRSARPCVTSNSSTVAYDRGHVSGGPFTTEASEEEEGFFSRFFSSYNGLQNQRSIIAFESCVHSVDVKLQYCGRFPPSPPGAFHSTPRSAENGSAVQSSPLRFSARRLQTRSAAADRRAPSVTSLWFSVAQRILFISVREQRRS
ncbi:hypothetical protein F2P81_012303 [Scophthalmus maximus]|uniref:Uncharacterized protein n=1 Tax=Scophthalmus maximus TaxID=52904 RepID=A0A6A4SPM0_SCOMX|nr:hypothetical protein F2P81_012303 [Scophthalmus maximus]